jgi:hypothetical protein
MLVNPTAFAVRTLYVELTRHDRLYSSAFTTWHEAFESLHGSMERKRHIDRALVGRAYGLGEGISVPHPIFAVETFLALYLLGSIETLANAEIECQTTR